MYRDKRDSTGKTREEKERGERETEKKLYGEKRFFFVSCAFMI